MNNLQLLQAILIEAIEMDEGKDLMKFAIQQVCQNEALSAATKKFKWNAIPHHLHYDYGRWFGSQLSLLNKEHEAFLTEKFKETKLKIEKLLES